MKYKYKNPVDAIQFLDTAERLEQISDFIGDEIKINYSKSPSELELNSYFINFKKEKLLLKSTKFQESDWVVKRATYPFTKFTNKDFLTTFENAESD